jgi:hypothetical protein
MKRLRSHFPGGAPYIIIHALGIELVWECCSYPATIHNGHERDLKEYSLSLVKDADLPGLPSLAHAATAAGALLVRRASPFVNLPNTYALITYYSFSTPVSAIASHTRLSPIFVHPV